MRHAGRCLLFLCLMGVASVTTGALAADQPPPAEATQPAVGEASKPPQVQAVYADAPPIIDGQLDDPCWSQAARVSDFYVLELDQPLPEETTALICVDSNAIYVGFICRDRTPEDIVAQETRRNGDIWNDDCVGVGLDPWHKHGVTYDFNVNARGTQSEDIPGGSATKIQWRGDWTAAAARNPEGWTAEMAIPFSILPYPPGQTTFSFGLSRHLAKEKLAVCYPDTGRPWNPLLTADLVGLHPPAVKPRPLFMPYLTFDFGENADKRADAGLDVQYKLPSGLTALAALNPDFRNIEDVVEPISFSYVEKYLYDPRPFFVTGQEGFFPKSHLFYSRRIHDFDLGAKLFGTVGNETIGLLDAITFGAENSFVGAWRHRFDDYNGVQLSLVRHDVEGEPGNTACSIDAGRVWQHLDGTDQIWTVDYLSRDADGRSGAAYALGGDHERGNGQPQWGWMYRLVTQDFHPALGYFTSQNTNGGYLYWNRSTRYEKGRLQGQGWGISTAYYPYLHGGGVLRTGISPSYQWQWRNGRTLSLQADRMREYNQDSSDLGASLGWNTQDLYRQGYLYALKGVRAGGDYAYLSAQQGFRPKKNLSVGLGAEYSHLAPPSPEAYHAYQTVLTASYDLTPEKCISLRLIARDGGYNAYAAYRQVVRRGMDAYILVGEPDPSRTGLTNRVAVKLIWAF